MCYRGSEQLTQPTLCEIGRVALPSPEAYWGIRGARQWERSFSCRAVPHGHDSRNASTFLEFPLHLKTPSTCPFLASVTSAGNATSPPTPHSNMISLAKSSLTFLLKITFLYMLSFTLLRCFFVAVSTTCHYILFLILLLPPGQGCFPLE